MLTRIWNNGFSYITAGSINGRNFRKLSSSIHRAIQTPTLYMRCLYKPQTNKCIYPPKHMSQNVHGNFTHNSSRPEITQIPSMENGLVDCNVLILWCTAQYTWITSAGHNDVEVPDDYTEHLFIGYLCIFFCKAC